MMPGKEKEGSSSVELDPLLKDLTEKKLSFRKNVVSLATELKDVRHKLASQELSFIRESQSRKVAEMKAQILEDEVGKLQFCLEDRNRQLQVSSSSSEQYLKELDGLRSQLSFTQATAEASAASAQLAQAQCISLLRELDEKDCSLKENEIRLSKLGEQLDNLQKDLQARELSQRQLKDEVLRVERDIMQAVLNAGINKDCDIRRILDEVTPKNFENMNKLLDAKDDEIARLRDEIRFLSSHWKHKTKELESQLEKQRRADQELKKKVLKLEFCLQEARCQMRKIQRAGERREKAIKELRDQLAMQQHCGDAISCKPNFWENSSFKVVVSMSMLVLVAFLRR